MTEINDWLHIDAENKLLHVEIHDRYGFTVVRQIQLDSLSGGEIDTLRNLLLKSQGETNETFTDSHSCVDVVHDFGKLR